jgi:hypothetical protein
MWSGWLVKANAWRATLALLIAFALSLFVVMPSAVNMNARGDFGSTFFG